MKRLLQWAFNGAATVSAVLCVATCVLWVRSHRLFEYAEWGNGDDLEYTVGQLRGAIYLTRTSNPYNPQQPFCYVSQPAGPIEIGFIYAEPRELVGGFGWFNAVTPGGSRLRIIVFPHWFLVLATAAYPTMRLWSRVHRTRRPQPLGLCPHCGYDLRATPGRCPECGTVPARKGAA